MSDLEENRIQIKTRLMKQYKAYRNFALKIAILLGSITFAIHFCFIAITRDPAALQIEDAFLQSALSSIAFSVLGYCIGSLIGTVLQRKHFRQLEQIKSRRQKALKDQISIRESRLESLQQEQEYTVF
jgi:uncharacterized protein YacL